MGVGWVNSSHHFTASWLDPRCGERGYPAVSPDEISVAMTRAADRQCLCLSVAKMATMGTPERGSVTEGFVRRAGDIAYEPVDQTDGLSKGVLVDETRGAPNLALRRFTIAPGGSVPRHTNAIEHEQYVLTGEYVVGIDETEYTVRSGDVVHIPAETVHWYRNEGDEAGAFICAVPAGNDEIQLVE